MDRPDVIAFTRTVGGKIAGGARAVLQRANLFAELGYPVTVVVTGTTSDVEVARLRARGDLHPDVRLKHFVTDGPSWQDRVAASARMPVEPPRLDERTPGVRREVIDSGKSKIIRTLVDDQLRSEEVRDTDGLTTRSFRRYDEHGQCSQLWRYQRGRVVMVDELIDGVADVRHFYLDGRLRWLTAQVAGTSGTGRAVHHDGTETDYAGAIAGWLDREFADRARLVVFADGENVWQRTLRSMRHPGVRGVSILHNSHLDEPYDAAAPTKPDWQPYFSDTRNVDVMVCLTARQREHLLQRYPGLPLRLVHHAVPARPGTSGSAASRRIVFLGRLAEQKRLDHLVEVFDRVAAAVDDVVLDVYGHGTQEDEFRRAIDERGLSARVNFAGFTDDALGAFAAGRVSVMTSRYEGLPLTLTESMSVGTPFVAYDINYGPAEVIRDGVDGFLVPPGDVDQFAERVVRLLTDDSLAMRMSAAAREVSTRFSRQRYRTEWLEVLQTAAADRSTPTSPVLEVVR